MQGNVVEWIFQRESLEKSIRTWIGYIFRDTTKNVNRGDMLKKILKISEIYPCFSERYFQYRRGTCRTCSRMFFRAWMLVWKAMPSIPATISAILC